MKSFVAVCIALILTVSGGAYAADTKISALTDGSATVASTWVLPFYDGVSANYRATLGQAMGLYTGSLGATGSRVTKGWLTNLEITNYPTVNGAAVFDQDVSADGNPSFSTINVVGANSLNLGTSGSLVGGIRFKNGTSGYVEVLPPTGALGTGAITLPASGTLQTTTGTPAGFTIDSQAIGDILYASSTTAWSRLASGATAGMYIRSAGAGAAPIWSTVILPNAGTAFKLGAWTATNTLTELAAVGATGELLVGNTGAIPTWLAAGTSGYILKAAGAGVVPAWTNTFQGTMDDSAAQIVNHAVGTQKILFDAHSVVGANSWLPVSSGAAIFTNNTVGAGTYKQGLLEVAGTWSGQQTFVAPVLGAATATSLIATGIVDGLVNTTIWTTGAITANATGKMSQIIVNKHATPATAFPVTMSVPIAGMQLIVKNGQGAGGTNTGAITLIAGTNVIIYNPTTKVDCTATQNLVSGGAAGDYVALIAIDATHWESVGGVGTWACAAP